LSSLLEIDRLVRRFGGIRAVDDASFTVDEASITSLIGPNGAGKSTLFNVVSGFLRSDAGRVLLAGRQIHGRPPHAIARAGLVRTFQTPRSLMRMTVRENVLLAAAGHPGERLPETILRPRRARRREQSARARSDELLALVRLDRHADALASTLSGGQRKLLDFARALMAGPRLLLLDEPMAAVNPTLRVQLLEHVLDLREREGMTFLLVEHDLELVMRASDTVVVMNEGRVIASGPPEAVRNDARVVDAYLGAAP
jgi:ABC-type branched-subunit amino acid transport system ATPase component